MNPIDATVFVYRHIQDGVIECAYLNDAQSLEDNVDYEHLATINPLVWIERHYEEIMKNEV